MIILLVYYRFTERFARLITIVCVPILILGLIACAARGPIVSLVFALVVGLFGYGAFWLRVAKGGPRRPCFVGDRCCLFGTVDRKVSGRQRQVYAEGIRSCRCFPIGGILAELPARGLSITARPFRDFRKNLSLAGEWELG